jgi:hypothetical protein
MSHDDHRAPSRLASSRRGASRRSPPSPRGTRPRALPLSGDIFDPHGVDDRAFDEQRHVPLRANYRPPRTSTGETEHNGHVTDASQHYYDTPPEPAVEPPSMQPPGEPLAALPDMLPQAEMAHNLSQRERHELLMHTIALYDEEWKLGGIRANEHANWLVAYLTPRGKHIDLKTAIKKRQALIIAIDNLGNTNIKEPKKRGLWRLLTSWLYGD